MDPETTNTDPVEIANSFFLANSYLEAGNPLLALGQLNPIINQGCSQPSYFVLRARAHSHLNQFDNAANDMAQAIQIEPDNGSYYWLRGGYLLSDEVHKQEPMDNSNENINRILNDYTQSLERDPTDRAAWINLIEMNVILRRWDDAIAHFGASRSYMTSPSFQVIRSFLGCLALTLAGDEITDEDRSALDDVEISVSHSLYRFSEVEILLQDLVEEGFTPTRVSRAGGILDLFLEHFQERARQHQSFI